jgi:hypothetical protein
MTRNGKIARLSKTVREELNRRLDNNEPGKCLVAWLNSLPEVQTLIATEFGGKPMREQNLSEWKKGGYRDWQARQERRELICQLQEEAKTVETVMDPSAINRHLSVVLTAELAKAVKNLAEKSNNPDELAKSLAQLVGRFAQLRREESNASRAEIVREQWNQELARRESNKRACSALLPLQALSMQQFYIETFSRFDARSLAAANELALGLCEEGNLSPALPSEINPTESD